MRKLTCADGQTVCGGKNLISCEYIDRPGRGVLFSDLGDDIRNKKQCNWLKNSKYHPWYKDLDCNNCHRVLDLSNDDAKPLSESSRDCNGWRSTKITLLSE